MQNHRSKKLVGLALNQKIESADAPFEKTPRIKIIEEKTPILDEKSGYFIFRKVDEDSTNDINVPTFSSNAILNETTGQLVLIACTSQSPDPEQHLLSESDFEDSGTEYAPSESSTTSEVSDYTETKILNESTGVMKKKRARKGQGNKNNWARNKLKRKRMKGQEYVSIKRKKNEGIVGKETRKKRTLQPRCESETCKKRFGKQCHKISDAERKTILNAYWDLTWEERKGYVVALVSVKPVAATKNRPPSRRHNTLEYSLKVRGEILPVCKKMFCSTLCLGEWSVLNWVKAEKTNTDIGMRKKHSPLRRQKKINIIKKDHVIVTQFLTALPKMPSHYCRKSTSKEYVDVNYTTWAEVYCDFERHLKDHSVPDVEKPTYKCFLDIIHKLDISIYHPKKDQCDLCYAYKNKNVSEEDYQCHIQARDRARKEKEADKLMCLDGELQMLTVDLQAVQSIPLILAGAQYFKLKLCVHQFTIYNEYDRSVVCYVWHEGEGGVGANIFASCLLDYFERLDKTKPIIIYSDGCSAQNRNVTLANTLQHFAVTNRAVVVQKYLVVGHTQMECDSVHATIEKKKKGKELFVPADFASIIKQARQAQPYDVRYLNHSFFRDFSSLGYMKSIRPGFKKGDPCVVDIKAIKYTPDSGTYYKLCYDDDWSLLPHTKMTRLASSLVIPKLYGQPLAIAKRKYDDLQDIK